MDGTYLERFICLNNTKMILALQIFAPDFLFNNIKIAMTFRFYHVLDAYVCLFYFIAEIS